MFLKREKCPDNYLEYNKLPGMLLPAFFENKQSKAIKA